MWTCPLSLLLRLAVPLITLVCLASFVSTAGFGRPKTHFQDADFKIDVPCLLLELSLDLAVLRHRLHNFRHGLSDSQRETTLLWMRF